MNKKIKSQKGIISVFAMMAMLFFLLFILGAYMAISRNNRTQKESNREILEIYSSDINPQDIYDEMVANDSDVIPLYTYDQVNSIGSNNFFAIDGKIYCFKSANLSYSTINYEVKTNLSLLENSYGGKNFNHIDKKNNKYVESSHLKLSLDGINNTGEGHDNKISKWTSLVNYGSYGMNISAFDIYSGGNKIDESPRWLDNGLSLSGSGSYVKCNGILNAKYNAFTYEIVFKTNNLNKNQNLIGNWNNGGSGLTYKSDGTLYGEVALPNNIIRKVTTSGAGIKENDITHSAITFDGQKISIYKNGKKISGDVENVMEKASTETIEYETLPTKTYNGDDYKIRMGIHSYIGKTDENSANGITIQPYFVEDDNYKMPSYRIDQGGKVNPTYITIDENITESGSTFYRNISDLTKEYTLKFYLGMKIVMMSGLKTFDLEYGYDNHKVKIGNLDTEDEDSAFTVIANGSDSVVIRSNIGKIQTWYFNDRQKLTSSNNGEVEILGKYYYCFDNLEPNTVYNIRGEFSTDSIALNVVGDSVTDIYIGNSYDNKFEGISGAGLNGVVYVVRVYDKALSPDNINTNYQIDKNRFSIKD